MGAVLPFLSKVIAAPKRLHTSLHVSRNSTIFTGAVWSLFRYMSTWDKSATHPEGITLSLGAVSPSDSEHWLRNYHLHESYAYSTYAPHELLDNFSGYTRYAESIGLDNLHDPQHGWHNGHSYFGDLLRTTAKVAIDVGLLRLKGGRTWLPKVPAIDKLDILRGSYRNIEATSFHRLIRDALPGLRELRNERWDRLVPTERLLWEEGMPLHFLMCQS